MKCDSRDIALKSFFLGPQAENARWVGEEVGLILERWFRWRRSLFPQDGQAISEQDQATPEFVDRRARTETCVSELLERFEKEVPKFSPRYAGHMFSEVSLPALFGHIVTLLHNPNNVSAESSRVGVVIESEAVAELARMIGFDSLRAAGHFTCGGTLANFEALVRARERLALWISAGACAIEAGHGGKSLFEAAHMGWAEYDSVVSTCHAGGAAEEKILSWNFASRNPWSATLAIQQAFRTVFHGPVILVPEHGHYSWRKGASLFGLGDEALWPIELDCAGRLSVAHLELQLERARRQERPVAMVVSVAGSTELGQIDPVNEVIALLARWKKERGIDVWHHVDAAFGGFFCSLVGSEGMLSSRAIAALASIREANSATLDPHKLGYVPYSSGAFLARDRREYELKPYHPAYIQHESRGETGQFTLEGSRSAAGAVATWTTAKAIGLNGDGYGRILARTLQIRNRLAGALPRAIPNLRVVKNADTNILCFAYAFDREPVTRSNDRADRIYAALSPAGGGEFVVSKTTLSWRSYGIFLNQFVGSWGAEVDAPGLVLIRMVLMNPFFSSIETKIDFEKTLISVLKGME